MNLFSLFFYRQVPNLELQEKVTLLLSKDHFKYFRKNPLDLLLLLNNVNLINRILDDGLNSSYKITKIFFHSTRVCFEKTMSSHFKKKTYVKLEYIHSGLKKLHEGVVFQRVQQIIRIDVIKRQFASKRVHIYFFRFRLKNSTIQSCDV